jgi:NarL family two-component system response regulator LiaR
MSAKGEYGSRGMPRRILIVDDQAVFRGALRELLEDDGWEIVAEADGAEEGIARIRELTPDLVIMDVRLHGASGIEAARELLATEPATRILMLSASDRFADAEQAILAGGCGYLLKDSPVVAIRAGVRAAMAGEAPLSPRIAAEFLRRFRAERALGAEENPLTERESAVLHLMMDGRSNPEIAAELSISKQTVKNHVSSVLGKLGVENRTQAAAEAVRRGLA